MKSYISSGPRWESIIIGYNNSLLVKGRWK